MSKFEKLLSVLYEALPPPPPDDDSEILNFDDNEESPQNQNLPVEGEDSEGPAESDEDSVNTPQEFELARMAIKALFAKAEDFNPKIYDDFEEGESSPTAILNYVESKLGVNREIDIVIEDAIKEIADERGFDYSPETLRNKRLTDKLAYFNQNFEGFQDAKLEFWTRIILNALRYKGNDYNLVADDLNPDSIDTIFDKLKSDFNYDTRGMFNHMVRDLSTGSNISGPGVF